MTQTVEISPVTRIEGHSRILIRLDPGGTVIDARLHVQEFRGFESFCTGRPFWEMPGITARICGICPVSHAIASAMAGDMILGVAPPPTAVLLRRVLLLGQLILSHSLSFFHLSGPDIVMGLDAAPETRNILGLAKHSLETARCGIRLRQIGQEIVNLTGGGRLHPEYVVPGGIREPLPHESRGAISSLLPEAKQLVLQALEIWKGCRDRFNGEMGEWHEENGLWLGLVNDRGNTDHLGSTLRFADEAGFPAASIPVSDYAGAIAEEVIENSYMKGTTCILDAAAEYGGLYRSGPLARLIAGSYEGAPLASREREDIINELPSGRKSILLHHARIAEMLFSVERLETLIDDDAVCDTHVMAHADVNCREGIGITEAPRGTLIHHYTVDAHGLLERVRLIVATGHNSRAINDTITGLARLHLNGKEPSETLLNRIEHGVRLYDPCLSCATHVTGARGIPIDLVTVRD